ncbi:MAG: sucrase ferredoxin, partial [Trichodesmium sp. St4_bin8_1]|nr:sucrase ferredoxin [Trichodesmium sp. St4_bin8_1]
LHLDINFDKTLVQTQLAVLKPDGYQYICQAKLVKDESKTIYIKGSCDASHESEFIKYVVSNLSFIIEKKTSEKMLISSHKKVS